MNKEEHFTLAFILLIGFYFLLNWMHLSNYFSYAGLLLIGSILPDILEPAKDYTHRDYFHSERFLKLLYKSLIPLVIIGLFLNQILYLFFLILGYISHLWLDSTTPMGLPK